MRWCLVLALLLAPAAAAAQEDEATCQSSYVAGQRRYKLDHDLLGGREQLRLCAKSCPDQLRASCGKWLREIENELPSIIVKAVDGRGRDVTDVSVELDEAKVAYVDGLALELNPGKHALRVRDRGGKQVEQTVKVSAGEKLKVVVVELEPRAVEGTRLHRPVPIGTFVLLGVGAAALATSATFAIWSSVEFSKTTSCTPNCNPLSRDGSFGVKTAMADASLGVGVAALLGAAAVYLLRPGVTERATVGVTITPILGPSYAGMSLSRGL